MRKWLKEARTQKGYTLSQMAIKLDITESYYCMIEKGERQKKMDILLLDKLSRIFDMPLSVVVAYEQEESA